MQPGLEYLANLPIFACTTSDNLEEFLRAGMNGRVLKPVSVADIQDLLRPFRWREGCVGSGGKGEIFLLLFFPPFSTIIIHSSFYIISVPPATKKKRKEKKSPREQKEEEEREEIHLIAKPSETQPPRPTNLKFFFIFSFFATRCPKKEEGHKEQWFVHSSLCWSKKRGKRKGRWK